MAELVLRGPVGTRSTRVRLRADRRRVGSARERAAGGDGWCGALGAPHTSRWMRGSVLALWDERSEQPVGLVIEAGREEERVRSCTRRRGGKAQPPQPVDHDGAATGPAELALELATRRVVGVDPPIAEV